MTDPATPAPDIDPQSLVAVLDAEFSELYDIVQIECPAGPHRVAALGYVTQAKLAARMAVLHPGDENPFM